MTSQTIREKWIQFFINKNHYLIKPQSLVPKNDDSILWVNSGVSTLKDYFTGLKKPPALNLVNIQPALRTNDIEKVGHTSRHLTFFEMLGNFSIGGYFKKEMISYALEFLVDILKMPKEKLFITYYYEDLETLELWIKAGINKTHIIPGDKKTNFWDLGSGPCGPNTEIFYDRGSQYDPGNKGISLLKEDIENDRYIEIWNIVFSQFNNDGNNNYTNLHQKNIDTGAGLERIAGILQDVPTNFDSDLFANLIKNLEKICKQSYQPTNYFQKDPQQTIINRNFKIIVDHIRAIVFGINDGVKPSNTGRGYIIRRLIRRAYRTGIQLGVKAKEFLFLLVEDVSNSFPDHSFLIEEIKKVIKNEENRFGLTINEGDKILKKAIKANQLNEKTAFHLFETFGFPIEMTKEIAKEYGIKLNTEKILQYQKGHTEISKQLTNKGFGQQVLPLIEIKKNYTEFVGYTKEEENAEIIFLFDNDKFLSEITNKGMFITNKTPFYATKGGQSHDLGYVSQNNSKAKVIDVFEDKEGNHIHVVEMVKGKLTKGKVFLKVDPLVRLNLERNHSATHLVYAALINQLGMDVFQLGSDNNQNRLKFDFPLDHFPTQKEIIAVEEEMNAVINKDIKREYIITDYDTAKQMGALSLPRIKLRNQVRVVKFNDYSLELCGGTHISNTKKIEQFLITKIESKGSNLYRLEGLTSFKTIASYYKRKGDHLKHQISGLVSKIKKVKADFQFAEPEFPVRDRKSLQKVETILSDLFKFYKKLNKQTKKKPLIQHKINPQIINNIPVLIDLTFSTSEDIKRIVATLREANPDAIIVLGFTSGDNLVVAVAAKKYSATNFLRNIMAKSNGKGGGSEIFAQGKCPKNPKIIEIIKEVVNEL